MALPRYRAVRAVFADLESGLGPALAVFARKDGKLRLVYLQSVSL